MTITNEEVDRQLKNYGIDIEKVKGDFELLFPEAAGELKKMATQDLARAEAEGLWLGFKAGFVWAYRMVDK